MYTKDDTSEGIKMVKEKMWPSKMLLNLIIVGRCGCGCETTRENGLKFCDSCYEYWQKLGGA